LANRAFGLDLTKRKQAEEALAAKTLPIANG
jgi:hypothetical protein